MKKKILVVFGTRPEAIKMASVIKAIEKQADVFELITCVTGQHRQILDQMLAIFEIQPDIDLDVMEVNQTLYGLSAKAMIRVSEVLEKVKPDAVLVQGDTTTAMIAALAGFYAKVPVGHVEAGLRTDNQYNPFPEEINRRLISVLGTWHFAPTPSSAKALEKEGIDKSRIFMTGNTVIDALLMTAAKKDERPADFPVQKGRYILVTAHRRENFGQPIEGICKALATIVEEKDIEIIYPVHPNPNISEPVKRLLADNPKIHLIDPMEYENFVLAMKHAHIILTDSGGVQEEAPSLGKPVLVLRDTTERPEAVDAGVACLIGTQTDVIVKETLDLLENKERYEKMARAANPFGDGTAAENIVSILKKHMFEPEA